MCVKFVGRQSEFHREIKQLTGRTYATGTKRGQADRANASEYDLRFQAF